MKKLVFVLLLGAILLSCKTEEKEKTNQFTISGEIEGLEFDLLYHNPDREYSRDYPSDTIKVENGKFQLTDSITKLGMIRVYTPFVDDNPLFKRPPQSRGYYPVKSMYLMFFAYPGANVTVSGKVSDFMDAYPSGNPWNESLAAINRTAFPSFNKSINLLVESLSETDSLKRAEIEAASREESERGKAVRIEHVEEHPASLGALWYLNDMVMRGEVDDQQGIALFENVAPELHDTELYRSLGTRIEGIAATRVGSVVPEIKTTSTLDGSQFDITSLRGKYVLIDFWGVWCGPCVAEMPQVKAFQDKYKDKLVVLGINSGDTMERASNFLEENGYDWPQVFSVKDESSDNFVTRFNVKGFPTKFIIDPKGVIVNRYLGSGEDAFVQLESLLGAE